ncbi:MAG: acyl-CoA dehydrogenase family protein [Thaumarchaeota archaeon]|nr:acyl-CoA dehydrogenase family protein [Nitrososphaerota archaeon]
MPTLNPRPTDYQIKITPEHEAVRQVARELAKKEIEAKVKEIEKNNSIPPEINKRLAEAGFFGITISEKHGGAGGDALMLALITEEISRVCPACSTILGGTFLVSEPLQTHATEEQKQRYLRPLAKGEKIGAHAMTEPAAGSDVAGIQTSAKPVGDKWTINGRKIFITNGDKADIFLVFARTQPPPSPDKRIQGITALIVEKGTEGFTVGGKINTIGLRGSQPSELIFNDAKVPKENILGHEGEGAYIALETYDRARIGVAAQGVGIAQAAYEQAAAYAANRKAFGNRLLEFQQIQFKLAEMAMNIHAARLLTYWAASLRDQGKEFVEAASMAKVFSTETAEKAALTAMMIHGGYGVSTEVPVERLLRDSQIIKTYEGTNDIQRLTIARKLIKELTG